MHLPPSTDYTSQLLQLWARMPQGDQARLLAFAAAMVKQRAGKRTQRAKRRSPKSEDLTP